MEYTLFIAKKLSDVAPPNYEINTIAGTGGYVGNMVSAGGAPLALALDDNSELEDRKYRENMRIDVKNPLSASFASRMENIQYRKFGNAISKLDQRKQYLAYQREQQNKSMSSLFFEKSNDVQHTNSFIPKEYETMNNPTSHYNPVQFIHPSNNQAETKPYSGSLKISSPTINPNSVNVFSSKHMMIEDVVTTEEKEIAKDYSEQILSNIDHLLENMNEDQRKRKREEYLMNIKQLLTSYVAGKIGELAVIQAANAFGVNLDNGLIGTIVKQMGGSLGESVVSKYSESENDSKTSLQNIAFNGLSTLYLFRKPITKFILSYLFPSIPVNQFLLVNADNLLENVEPETNGYIVTEAEKQTEVIQKKDEERHFHTQQTGLFNQQKEVDKQDAYFQNNASILDNSQNQQVIPIEKNSSEAYNPQDMQLVTVPTGYEKRKRRKKESQVCLY